VATTGAWPEALAYLSDHRRATTELRAAWVASRPCPDLRRAEYPRLRVVDVVSHNGHHPHAGSQPASVVQQLMAGALHTLARVVIGVHSFATGG
jgi:hypothetical protein